MTSIRKTGASPTGPLQPLRDPAAQKAEASAPAAKAEGPQAAAPIQMEDKFTAAARGPERPAAGAMPARPGRRLKGTDTERRTIEKFKAELQHTRRAQGPRKGRVRGVEDATAEEQTRKLPLPTEDETNPLLLSAQEETQKLWRPGKPEPSRARQRKREQKQDESPFAAADEEADREAALRDEGPGALPSSPGGLKQVFRELSRKSPSELEELHRLLIELRDAPLLEKAGALTRLAVKVPSPLRKSLKKVGIADEEVVQILEAPAFLKHAATLTNAAESPADRIGAALGLANALKHILPRDRLPSYLERAAPDLPAAGDIVRSTTRIADATRSAAERLEAAIDLTANVQDVIARENLSKFLKRFATTLPLAQDLAGLVGTVSGEDIPSLDKARAVIHFARSAQAAVGEEFPRIAAKLGRLRPEVVGAALTLIDPDSSRRAKAEAALRIWSGENGSPASKSTMREGLQRLLVPHPADIASLAARLGSEARVPAKAPAPPPVAPPPAPRAEEPPSAEWVPDVQLAGFTSGTAPPAPPLPQASAERLRAAEEGLHPAPAAERTGDIEAQMSRLLLRVDHFSQVHNLLRSLERLDPADPSDNSTRKAMLEGVSGMEEAALRTVLTDTVDGKPIVSLLVEVLGKLPNEESKYVAADLLKDLDGGAVRLFLKLSSQVSLEVLGQLFRGQDADSGFNAIADAINTLADVLRNPERAGRAGPQGLMQAIEGLQKLAEAAGEVGLKARRTLESIVGDFKLGGEKGLEQLAAMAAAPGRAADAAQAALGEMAAEGFPSSDQNRRKLARRALDVLDGLCEAYPEARPHLNRAIAAIAEQGEEALELLRTLAPQPGAAGEAAQQEMLEVVLRGGSAAENAYHLLVGLEETGVDALARLRRYALKHGEKAVEVLDWIARHPGRGGADAIRDAVRCLKDIADFEERIGRNAVAKLVGLADEGGRVSDAAVEALVDLLQANPFTASEIIGAWRGNRKPGNQKVLDALVLLGEAGADALRRIADGGGELGEQAHVIVGDVFDRVLDVLGSWSLDPFQPET